MPGTVKILFSDEASSIIDYISRMSISSKEEKIMHDAINRKLDLVRLNPKYGQPIAKRLIPKEY